MRLSDNQKYALWLLNTGRNHVVEHSLNPVCFIANNSDVSPRTSRSLMNRGLIDFKATCNSNGNYRVDAWLTPAGEVEVNEIPDGYFQ